MRPVKCNKCTKFYDADKYNVCPHCRPVFNNAPAAPQKPQPAASKPTDEYTDFGRPAQAPATPQPSKKPEPAREMIDIYSDSGEEKKRGKKLFGKKEKSGDIPTPKRSLLDDYFEEMAGGAAPAQPAEPKYDKNEKIPAVQNTPAPAEKDEFGYNRVVGNDTLFDSFGKTEKEQKSVKYSIHSETPEEPDAPEKAAENKGITAEEFSSLDFVGTGSAFVQEPEADPVVPGKVVSFEEMWVDTETDEPEEKAEEYTEEEYTEEEYTEEEYTADETAPEEEESEPETEPDEESEAEYAEEEDVSEEPEALEEEPEASEEESEAEEYDEAEDEIEDEDEAEEEQTAVLPIAEAVRQADAVQNSNDEKTVAFYNLSNDTEPVVGWLVCIRGEYHGESFSLKTGRNNIGRALTMDIALAKEKSVSREKHASVIFDPLQKKFFVQSGEGRSLVHVNGELLMSHRELKANDVILLGNCKLMFIPLCGENFDWEDYI